MADFGSSEAGKKGAKARAAKLTKAERSEIARGAAEARWEREGKLKNKVLKATHGDPDHPLRIGKLEIPCYVLEDGTRVLSGRGMQAALGLGQGHGALLNSFLGGKNLKAFIGNDLAMVLEQPIRFVRPGRGGKLAVGYEATVLADICDLILEARKQVGLTKKEGLVAIRCEVLTRAFAKVGIIALVDEATGYQDERSRDALAKILQAFVANELRKWVKTFPVEFYRELFRLRGLPFNGTCKKPGYIGHLTNDLIYSRLAPGVLEELRRKNPRSQDGHRKVKHHQWLTEDTGHPALRQHLHAVTTLMRVSETWDGFYAMLDRAFKPYKELPLFKLMGVDPDS